MTAGLQSRKEERKLRRYETILIAHVDLSEDELNVLTERYSALVAAQKGILIKVERWGKRRLAYLINKQARGFYILFDYACLSAVVTEFERNLKIDDKILKFMTVLKDDAVDADALQKEIEEAASKTGKKDDKATAITPPAAPSDRVADSASDEIKQPVPEEASIDAKGGN
jgi:small subunit ribosomal protein S6